MVIHVCDESKNCKLLLLLMDFFFQSVSYFTASRSERFVSSISFLWLQERPLNERRLEYFTAPLP